MDFGKCVRLPPALSHSASAPASGLLVDQFLTLPTENDTVHTFTRAQRHWDRPADLTALFTTSVSPATHTIQPSAEGDGWSEVQAPPRRIIPSHIVSLTMTRSPCWAQVSRQPTRCR